jgi:hypothetical protein
VEESVMKFLVCGVVGMVVFGIVLVQRLVRAPGRSRARAALAEGVRASYPNVCVHCGVAKPQQTRLFLLHPEARPGEVGEALHQGSSTQSRFSVTLPCCTDCLRLGRWRSNLLVTAFPLSLFSAVGALVAPGLMLPLGAFCGAIVLGWLAMLYVTRRARLRTLLVSEKNLILDIPGHGAWPVAARGILATGPDTETALVDILERAA